VPAIERWSVIRIGKTVSQKWTTADFDDLSWHDCHIHGFRLGEINGERGTAELEFDIDFIVEWLAQGDSAFRFRIAPATLTFNDVFGLRVELDYAAPGAGMTPFSIDGIRREPLSYPTGYTSFRWRLPVSWPTGEITFDSPGFTQVLRREPIVHENQCLTAIQRCG
jgi:hypothetical protein